MESIKSEFFGKVQTIATEEMRAIQGGFAQTKTKGSKTKETAQDKDSSSSQENPKQQLEVEMIQMVSIEMSKDSLSKLSE